METTHVLANVAAGKIGHDWPQATRDYAYELWALDEAGDATRIARRLAAEGYGDVPTRTIRYWRQTDSWDERLAQTVALAFPRTMANTASRLVLSSEDAAAYVQRVNAGIEPPNKDRLNAAFGVLDRVGHSPLGRSTAPTIEQAKEVVALPDFASMTPEERRAWELERREQMRATLRRTTR